VVLGQRDDRARLADADGVTERTAQLLDELHAEIQAARIQVAQNRDDALTEAEMIAMLEVYEEFGR
jgi:hypothetical protein